MDEANKLEKNGFITKNHMTLVELKEHESAIIRAELEEDSLNPFGNAHGGFIFGLGDTAMGVVTNSKDNHAVTVSASINYLRPANGKYLIAKAKMVKDGKHVCFLETEIYNDQDVLVATMNGNFYYVN